MNYEIKYSKLYKSIKNMTNFDKKVKKYIDKKYGGDTLENIIKTHEYNKEIDNVRKGIITNVGLNRLAERYNQYFNSFLNQRNKLRKELDNKEIDYIIEEIKRSLDDKYIPVNLIFFTPI